MQDQKLMNYFKFDEADLQANRNGQVTGKTKGAYDQGFKIGRNLGESVALLFLFIGLIGFVMAIVARNRRS